MGFRPPAPEICPICGEDVPPGARACPECGADHETGWTDDENQAAGDLPDEDFDYEAFIEREFGSGARPTGIRPIWWVTAIILVIAFLGVYLFR
ncbi:MAG: zinc ribbon domain-containing protein [Verrucomicrobia bacterium]|nr:MAG: zinc ribbon domain-containing protein [Verrucomicrobiota bacterium]